MSASRSLVGTLEISLGEMLYLGATLAAALLIRLLFRQCGQLALHLVSSP